MTIEIEPVIIEAVDDDDCLNYVKKNKKGEWVDVKEGEQIGVEVWNPRIRAVELLLFSDIAVGDN